MQKKNFLQISTVISIIICLMLPSLSLASSTQMFKIENKRSLSTYSHTVLVEEATATWCSYCPPVARYLEELYTNELYDFSYVALVWDMNPYARGRALELGVTGLPTVIYDGGFTRVIGSGGGIEPHKIALNTSGARSVANVTLTLSAVWNGSTNIDVTADVTNHNENDYIGHLHIYVTEIVSRWFVNGHLFPYSFAMIGDYALHRNVSISAGETSNYSGVWNASLYDMNDLQQDNIMIIATIFQSDSLYADQTVADTVVSPPNVPCNPNPHDFAIGVPTNAQLSWEVENPEQMTFDVYFGTQYPPTNLVSQGQTNCMYDPGLLNEGTTYYWQIIARHDSEYTPSPIWRFITCGYPSIVYVDDNFSLHNTTGFGYDHFNTIQDGIAAVVPNGTVMVFDGTYTGTPISITKSLTVSGQHKQATIISGRNSYTTGFQIHAPNVSLSGLSVLNCRGPGIEANSAENLHIKDIIISNCNEGIDIERSPNTTILRTTITTGSRGISLSYSPSSIIDNTAITNSPSGSITVYVCDDLCISNNTVNTSIRFLSSRKIHATNNTLVSGGFIFLDIYGDNQLSFWNTHTLEQNQINGRPIYYFKNIHEPTMIPSDAGQVILANCSNLTVQNCSIHQVECDIQIGFSKYIMVQHNSLSAISSSEELTPSAVYLQNSSNVTVEINNIYHSCFYLRCSSGNIFKGNVLAELSTIVLDSSNQNSIMDNTLYAAYLFWGSDNNWIYHNCFEGDYMWDDETNNHWNLGYPEGGNYWSVFSGDDKFHGPDQNLLGSDGILDTPHYVGGDSYDRYPFTKPSGWINLPPGKPTTPVGPKNGIPGRSLNYTSTTTDPENYSVYYKWGWGDGTSSSWLGPFLSGAKVFATHQWEHNGIFNVKVKAKDSRGIEGAWSESLRVQISQITNSCLAD